MIDSRGSFAGEVFGLQKLQLSQYIKKGEIKMKKRKIMALVLSAVMVAASLAGCTTGNGASSSSSGGAEDMSESTADVSDESETEDSSKPSVSATGLYPGTADSGSITVDIDTEPPDMNSTTTTDTICIMILKNTMENLVRLDEKDNIKPAAAESWDVSDDGLTYTFHLREGMKWANGDPVTAHDYEFGWKTVIEPSVASEYAYLLYFIEGAEAYNLGEGSLDDVKITATDDLTLEVVLTSPTEYFVSMTAFPTMSPVNEKFYNEVGADKYGTEADYLLSNGPFAVESWTHQSEMVMVKNDSYYNADAIQLPKVRFVMILENNASLNAFQAGEVDLTVLAEGSMVQQIEATGYEVLNYDDGSCFYMEYNVENPALSSVSLRKAISLAIDRQTFVDSVLQNSSRPSTSLTPQAVKGLDGPFPLEVGELIPPKGDTELALSLLETAKKELSMDEGEISKHLSIVLDDTDQAVKIGAYIQEQVKSKLGLDITIENMPFKNRLERMTNKDFDMVFAGWSPDYNDPNSFLDMFVTDGGNNHTRYSSEAYDKLIDDAAVELDPTARMGYFYQVEDLIAEDCMVAPIYWRVKDYVVSEKVQGIYRTAFSDMMFDQASLDE